MSSLLQELLEAPIAQGHRGVSSLLDTVLRHYSVRQQEVDLGRVENEQSGHMLGFFLSVFRLVRLLMSGHGAVALENAALRLQLAAFQRKRKRPMLTSIDRLFWVGLSLIWNGWRAALIYVQPDTVVRWQRERFRRFWARLSRVQHRRRGRPTTCASPIMRPRRSRAAIRS